MDTAQRLISAHHPVPLDPLCRWARYCDVAPGIGRSHCSPRCLPRLVLLYPLVVLLSCQQFGRFGRRRGSYRALVSRCSAGTITHVDNLTNELLETELHLGYVCMLRASFAFRAKFTVRATHALCCGSVEQFNSIQEHQEH